jgi:flavin reductase (DIM6/NTAB) family NADH-FMN oxidoreductase RutF
MYPTPYLAALALLAGCATHRDSLGLRNKVAVDQQHRFELPKPGPMIPPVPAIVLGVKGALDVKDDLTIVWTFVVEGDPPHIGISVPSNSAISGKSYVALDLLKKHGEFTLNVPDTSWAREFDQIDMTASKRADKFAANGLTRLPSKTIQAPGIAEAAIVLECRVLQSHVLPPKRTVFFAEVLRTSVHPGVTDSDGRLDSTSREFFGMTSGNGEFWSFGRKVGYIGQSVGRKDIRY